MAIQAEFITQFYHAAKKKHFRLKLANKTLKNGSDNVLLRGRQTRAKRRFGCPTEAALFAAVVNFKQLVISGLLPQNLTVRPTRRNTAFVMADLQRSILRG